MFEQSIGKRSEQVKNTVERGAVKKFAEAIGDLHPLYIDEAYGQRSRFGENIAPPTFPRVFAYGAIEGLVLPPKGLIHGEQRYHYTRPLLVGEDVYCFLEVKNYEEKAGKSGQMGILTLGGHGLDDAGEAIFTSEQVIIISAAVRRMMRV